MIASSIPRPADRSEAPAEARVLHLLAERPAAEAFARIEHEFGVLPLLERFFDAALYDEILADGKVGTLGLCTPTPEPGWEQAAIDAVADGSGALVSGAIRLANAKADGAIVLVRWAESPHRLAWLDRPAEPASSGSVGWWRFEGVAVGPERLSRGIDPAPGSALFAHLSDYASLWALAATSCAREGVHVLRRAVRLAVHRGKSWSGAQSVALGITELEIEADLAASAVRRHRALDPAERGSREDLAVAAAAARILQRVAARPGELSRDLGIDVLGPLVEEPTAGLSVALGGSPLLEAELARVLDTDRIGGMGRIGGIGEQRAGEGIA